MSLYEDLQHCRARRDMIRRESERIEAIARNNRRSARRAAIRAFLRDALPVAALLFIAWLIWGLVMIADGKL